MKQLNWCWRLLATAFSFVLFAIGALLLAILLAPLIRLLPWPEQRRRQLARRSIQRWVRFYVWIMCTLGLLTVEFEGEDALSQSGVLVVANHPTLLDAILLMAVMPNATFIMKAAMARNPFTCWIVSLAGYIPNDEVGVELVEKAAAALRSGETLMIFPEGTRTDGDELKLKRGAANIALAAACPLLPVVIDCQPMTLRKGEPWYRIPPTKPHFSLRVLPLIALDEAVDKSQPPGLQARTLTAELRDVLQGRQG
ncbi:1-acyl-sn-glycerol-3-phosphate acyltransferase [Cellvibrio sp. pealriver]|uniref:lysophospholipid acyltransferase family protein n=1 Tax=Cellvibrio sp. pealriver TaxID=1622269 RepID=UPI00066FD990|nr:lysophospholipid acyltransferase family protein [Cellvibrio sp. pealriver]